MMTVREMSRRAGVSVRTLHHYDAIGLLKPSEVTEAGYRLYDEEALERLFHILMLRELRFPLKEIGRMLDGGFDGNQALETQIALLEMERDRLDGIIDMAKEMRKMGMEKADFRAFDRKKIDEYAERARERWGGTDAYREFEQKNAGRSKEQEREIGQGLMELLAAFGTMKELSPEDGTVQAQVKRLQTYITAHYYRCTDEILRGLGRMYAAGGEMTENIDRAGGEGTAATAARAIEIYCDRK